MKFLKVSLVVFSAVVITSLGISAGDVFVGNSGSLLGQLVSVEGQACPEGMTAYPAGQTFSCVDTYEVSPSEQCEHTIVAETAETQENLNMYECMPQSVEAARPWVYVNRMQAQALCARAGKRLPTSAEWYSFAVGTPDVVNKCNTASENAALTGSFDHCLSSISVYDTVGNVWEWTSDDVIQGMFNNRMLPEDGHVTEADAIGLATETSEVSIAAYGNDYFWGDSVGVSGVLRGGFYGSGEDAGVYATHARIAPSDATMAIGFRCVK